MTSDYPPPAGPPSSAPPQLSQWESGWPVYGGPQRDRREAPVPGGRLAGIWQRVGARLLDVTIFFLPVSALGGAALGSGVEVTCNSDTCHDTLVHIWPFLTIVIVALVLSLAYFTYFVGVRGQTVGQRAAQIRVVDATTGLPIGVGRALVRELVLWITGSLCTLGFWTPLFDSRRSQGWHDKAARSVVIPAT